MDKDLIRGVILVFLTCVSFASLVSSNENKKTGTCCSDGLGLNYTLPMFNECKMKLNSNGNMVQTIPKLIPYTSGEAACPRRKSKLGISPGHRVCRFPDCSEYTCQNGWCEETMENFKCHCSAGYQGKRCDKQSSTTQDTTTMSRTESTTSHPTTTTQSSTTQDTTTMSRTEPTTSHPTTTTPSTVKIFVTDRGRISVADLQGNLNFTSINSSGKPRYITYDSVEKKIYWTDRNKDRRVYRADADGGNRKEVTSKNKSRLRGIAIAESSRILYIGYKSPHEITTVDIGQGSAFPGNETNFVTGLSNNPIALEMDEEQGFLYWSMADKILRKPLNGSGSRETVYHNGNLATITGLSIDLSRDPRRIFFCDKNRTFYMDVNQPLTMAHELTDYMNSPDINGDEKKGIWGDISYFNGTLYWVKTDSPSAIAVMTNYDQSSRSFDIKVNLDFDEPFQLLIINP